MLPVAGRPLDTNIGRVDGKLLEVDDELFGTDVVVELEELDTEVREEEELVTEELDVAKLAIEELDKDELDAEDGITGVDEDTDEDELDAA